MTAQLRLTVALILALLVVVPNAGAAPYPPSFALHPAFTSASIGTDGSILVNLEEEYEKSSTRHSTTSRYLANGQRDRSFKPERSWGAGFVEAVDSKGRILRPSAGGGIERLNPDGSVEASFGRPGAAGESVEFVIEAILPLTSGRIAIAGRVLGRSRESSGYEIGVALYDESGRPDPDFGTAGIVRLTEEVGIEGDEFVGLASGPSEDLLVAIDQKAWKRGRPSINGSGSRIVALNLNGKLEPSFAAGGVFSSPDPLAAVEGMPDGAILLAGTRWGAVLRGSRQARDSAVYLERLTPYGLPDTAFGEHRGRTTVDLGGSDVAHALLLRPDGSALIGGETTSSSPRCIIYEGSLCTETPALAGFTASGDLNRHFGQEGILRLGSLAYEFAEFHRALPVEPLGVLFLRELPGGRVLAGGGTEVDAFLAAIRDDGRLEHDFGDRGTVTWTNPRKSTTELGSMAIDRRGRIVVSGQTNAGGRADGESGAVFRFRAHGAVDRSFAGGQGYLEVQEPVTPSGPPQPPAGISLDAHSRALVLGSSFQSGQSTVTRIGIDGRPDRSFGIDGIAPLPRYASVDVGRRKVQLRLNLGVRLAIALPGGGSLVYARAGYDHGARLYPALIRLTSRGKLDRSFGHRGVRVIAGGAGGNFEASVMVVLSGGKTLLGGAIRSPGRSGYSARTAALVQLRSDGSLDPSFGHGGVAATPSQRWGRVLTSLALDPGGEIIAVGGTRTKWRKDGPHRLVGEILPVIDRFSARGRLDRGFCRRVIRTPSGPRKTSLSTAEQVILWRNHLLVSGQGVSGAFVYSPNGRFERRLIPAGQHRPTAGHSLGMAVQDGKPVVVTTAKDRRSLSVQRLSRPARPGRRRARR
jgi:uncharacterized delta-60 repeat protein